MPDFITEGKPIVFHLRHSRFPKDEYLKCINILLDHYRKDETFYFSTAVQTPIAGKINEFQSEGLMVGKGRNRGVLDTVTALPKEK